MKEEEESEGQRLRLRLPLLFGFALFVSFVVKKFCQRTFCDLLKCQSCHNADYAQSGLDLSSRAALLKGGQRRRQTNHACACRRTCRVVAPRYV
jgi:hypothetical protein